MYFQSNDVTRPTPIWPVLIRIRRTLGIGTKQMAGLLRLTQAQYKSYELQRKELSASSLLHLSQRLNISFDSLMTNAFCYRTMARHFFGDKSQIPEKYTIAGKSKRRILANLLDFVETASDWQRRLELMQHLQVNEAALDDPEGIINLQCTIEAVEWLQAQYRKDDLLERMGRDMLLAPHYKMLSDELSGSRSIYELFESIFSESGVLYRHLEKNFLWTIEKIVPGDRILVRGRVNEEIMGQIGKRHIQSRAGFIVRKGILSIMPDFIGLGAAPARITDFFSSNEDSCLMEIDIAHVLRAHRHRGLHLLN